MTPDGEEAPVTASAPRGPLRIALVYFGITRSLGHTLGSIRRNLVARARTPEVRQFGHFYRQDRIENPRSLESGPLDPEEYRLLELDEVELEPPGDCLDRHGFDRLTAAGDPWRDGFQSLRNLVHQLHSLQRATLLALDWQPDIVVFARPDLYYHAPLTDHFQTLVRRRRNLVLLPDWASWHGFNDRVAVVKGPEAMRAYGLRAARMGEYCAKGRKLHAERFLRFALAGYNVRPVPLHASRVRSTGQVVVEDFAPGRGRGGPFEFLPMAEFERGLAAAAAPQLEGAPHG
jgi:hypothetical protein